MYLGGCIFRNNTFVTRIPTKENPWGEPKNKRGSHDAFFSPMDFFVPFP